MTIVITQEQGVNVLEFILVLIVNGGEPQPLSENISFATKEACEQAYEADNLHMYERLGTEIKCAVKN